MDRTCSSHEPARRRRRPRGPLWVAGLAIAGLTLVQSAPAVAGERTPATVTYDLLVERPLGLVELATGLGITTVAYPIAAMTREGDVVVDHCVRTPTRSTFLRALGRLDDDRRSHCSPVAFGIELSQLSVGAALQPLTWIFGGSPFTRSEGEDGVEV